MATLDIQNKNIINTLVDAIWSRVTLDTSDQSTIVNALNEVLLMAKTIVIPIGGRFLWDPNETNGFWSRWPFYNTTQSSKLTTATSENFSRLAGWYTFPYDVKLKRFYAWHRNNNSWLDPWGWVIFRQGKVHWTISKSNHTILHEVNNNGWIWPRDYGTIDNQLTDIDLSQIYTDIIPAGEVIWLWVSFPTADSANRFVEIESWYFIVERVS